MSKTSIAMFAALALTAVAPRPVAADERCRQLEALRDQYSGVKLTADQSALKVKLVAWYVANCGRHEVASSASDKLVRMTR